MFDIKLFVHCQDEGISVANLRDVLFLPINRTSFLEANVVREGPLSATGRRDPNKNLN